MSYQSSEYRQQFLPEIDHRLAVWQAYLNCVNAFQANDMETRARGGEMRSESRVSTERFKYCLGVLDGQLDEDKDETFKKEGKPQNISELMSEDFRIETDNIGENAVKVNLPIEEYFAYWARLDKLMRRQQFYTTSKLPTGHL